MDENNEGISEKLQKKVENLNTRLETVAITSAQKSASVHPVQ